jgi:6-phosphogluconolactonase (cycloisomerase 2 family)
MRTRFTWILAVLALVSIGVVMACSTKYSSSSNGLVIVPTQGGAVMETFSLDLSSGRASQINDVNGPPINGVPTSLILDPAGAFAYLIIYQNPAVAGSATGIETFQVASDGKLTPIGTTPLTNPVALTIDSAGKFLFVANGSEGTVSVFSIGSNASLSEVTNSPFLLQFPLGGQNPNASALAVTPTVFPISFAACSGQTVPATENLYVADSVNYALLNYSVDLSTGALTLTRYSTPLPGIPTGTTPSGVAVDPCNRFVYVANAGPGSNGNSVSAYSICSTVNLNSQPPCQSPDYSLHPITGSPFAVSPGDGPGPMAADPYGNYLYVVDTGSSQVSGYRISPTNGSLTAIPGTPVATNAGPNSIAIRSDDTWLFVANFTSATLSQYAITPASGTLTSQPPITTLNQPTGVAVK